MKQSSLLPLIIFTLMFLWEQVAPYGDYKDKKANFICNILIALINTLILRLIIPIQIYQTLDQYIPNIIEFKNMPFNFLITILVFDMAIYWQHRFFHLNDFLFRMHKAHHTEEFLNVTSGMRFHFFELIISSLYKVFLLLVFNPSLENYLWYEALLLSFSLFNHANIKTNFKLELLLSKLFITPLIHRSHHSPKSVSMNKNFGNIFVFWDKLFKSFEIQETRTYGLSGCNYTNSFKAQMLIPFKKS